MALIAGPIQTSGYQAPDYSQAIEASRRGGMLQQQITQGAVGQVTDYFKQQGEKKKLIKQSDVQIDAALKLFPDLAPTLQGVRDQIRDENVPLNDRAAIAESVAGLINMGTNQMRFQAEQGLREEQLGISKMQQEASIEAAKARQIAAGLKPPATLDVPVAGGVQKTQWDPTTQSWVPIKATGLFDLVKEFEGFNPKAYSDSGQTSIGYGTRGKPGEVITEEEASRRLQAELAESAKRIEQAADLKGITLNQNQFDALVSFDFNTGKGMNLIGRFGDKPEALAAKMREYIKDEPGGKILPGLVKRRDVEAGLLLTPTEEAAIPSKQAPPVGFKPEEAKAFRPATPEESAPYGGVPGQIDTSTGQFYPITTSRESRGTVMTQDQVRQLTSQGFKVSGSPDPSGGLLVTSVQSLAPQEESKGTVMTPAQVEDYRSKGFTVNASPIGDGNMLVASISGRPTEEKQTSLQERISAFAEARRLYAEGKTAEALDIANALRLNGFFGAGVMEEDLKRMFELDPMAVTPSAPAAQPAPTQKQDSRPPLGELLSPR